MIKITINPNDRHKFPHVHVLHAEKSALISLNNSEVLENSGFSEKTLKKVVQVLKDHYDYLLDAWSEYNG